MTLADAIQQAHTANEQKIAAGVERVSEQLNAKELEHLSPFSHFCSVNGVRPCPANPKVIAAWIRSEKGADPNKINAALLAIERLHNFHSLPNPIATSVVRNEWSRLVRARPPRSWTKDEQLLFAVLPVEIQEVISKREAQREGWLRNKQNELAEQLKRLQGGADKPVANKEGTENVTEAK